MYVHNVHNIITANKSKTYIPYTDVIAIACSVNYAGFIVLYYKTKHILFEWNIIINNNNNNKYNIFYYTINIIVFYEINDIIYGE